MRITSKFDVLLRKSIGFAIIIHGLLKVIGIYDYVDLVVAHLHSIINNDTLLIFGATFLPFLEVLAGLLIFFRLSVKPAVILAFTICLLMSVIIILGDLSNNRLIFHGLTITGLLIIYFRYRDIFASNRLV